MSNITALSPLRRIVGAWILLLPLAAIGPCVGQLLDDDEDGFSPDEEDAALFDCNDNDAAVNPEAADICDGVDNDCDGIIDEGLDADGDGFFRISDTLCPSGNDCDDADALIHPVREEACNGIDDDCDGEVDLEFDLDLDGYTICGDDGEFGTGDEDCDDGDETIHPDADEVCNGLDDDCDGVIPPNEVDADLDGCPDCESCEDTVPPDATGLRDGPDEDGDDEVSARESDGVVSLWGW